MVLGTIFSANYINKVLFYDYNVQFDWQSLMSIKSFPTNENCFILTKY